jgi:hypothetical protein
VQDCLLLRHRQCLMRVLDDAHELLLHAHLSGELVHAVQWHSGARSMRLQMQVAHVAACSSAAGGW